MCVHIMHSYLLAEEQQLLEGSINQKYEIASNIFYVAQWPHRILTFYACNWCIYVMYSVLYECGKSSELTKSVVQAIYHCYMYNAIDLSSAYIL